MIIPANPFVREEMANARSRDSVAIVAFLAGLQGPEERPQTRMRSSDLFHYPQGVSLARGPDDPRENHRP